MPQHVYPACHELRGAQTPAILRNPDYEAQLFILVAPRRDMMDGEPEMLTVVRNSLRSSRACGKQIALGHMDNWCPGWESNPHEEKSPEDFKSSASAIPPPGHRQNIKINMEAWCAQTKPELRN